MKNIAFILTLVLFSTAAIGQKVNYSGDWKLNESKSELGWEFSLAPAAITVDHAKKTLDLKTTNVWEGTEVVSETHYTLDGKECTNIGMGDTETVSTAVTDKKAKTLTIVTNGDSEGIGEWTSTQVMSLKDGNLVISFEAASNMGELIETYVFDKK